MWHASEWWAFILLCGKSTDTRATFKRVEIIGSTLLRTFYPVELPFFVLPLYSLCHFLTVFTVSDSAPLFNIISVCFD